MTRPKVFIGRKIPQAALDIIAAACEYTQWDHEEPPVPRDVLLREIAGCDGAFTLLTDRVDAEFLDAAPRIKVVANMAVGYDNINVPECTRRGVMVTNTPGVLTETTADLAFALLMATARRFPEAMRYLRSGGWRTWSPMQLTGRDVYGATLGIVGMGRIGKAVARRAAGFSMQVLYHNRKPDPAAEAELGASYRNLDDLLRESDFVLILTPLNEHTRGLIGERELRLMKKTAAIINAARGGIVDEAALYRALSEGWIWAAGSDVFAREPAPLDHPLLTLPNFCGLPHIGSATVATRTKMAATAAANLVEALQGRRPPNLVNPEAYRGG